MQQNANPPDNTDTSPAPRSGGARRGFLKVLTALLGTVATVLVGVPFMGYVFGIRKRRVYWVNLGPVSDYTPQQTQLKTFDNPLKQPWDGMTAENAVYVRYEGKDEDQRDQFLVFSVNCAHLGCPVSWFPQSELFLCPCHGGVYYADGAHASGPPPRGLYHCVWRVRRGELEVRAPHYPTLHDTLKQTSVG